jgi:hypothetical protein
MSAPCDQEGLLGISGLAALPLPIVNPQAVQEMHCYSQEELFRWKK